MKKICSVIRHRFLKGVGSFVLVVVLVSAIISCVPGTDHLDPDAIRIRDWYDLNAIRGNLSGSYVLMNDLDSTTAGHLELAGPTANQGKGWEPIGTDLSPFVGTFDGQQYIVKELFIDRPDDDSVGLFGHTDEQGVVKNTRLVDTNVTGHESVGSLVGHTRGTVSDSYSTGSVSGTRYVGGLVGRSRGHVTNSWSIATVTGDEHTGGLVGYSRSTVRNSYYNYDEVLINDEKVITVGALFDEDFEQWLANDKFLDINERLSQEDGYYLIHDVEEFKQLLAFGQDDSLKFILEADLDLSDDANFYIPYLASEFDGNDHTISNLSFDLDSVSTVGLFGYLASGAKVTQLGIENVSVTAHRYVGGLAGASNLAAVSHCYAQGTVTGKERVGGLAGWNSGTVSASNSTGSVAGNHGVGGLVGYNIDGTVINSYSASSVAGDSVVGGLVGHKYGTIHNSYSTGSVAGSHSVGGLVGAHGWGTLSDSYSTGDVTGLGNVGGLVGRNWGTIANSYYNYDEVLINDEKIVTIGALAGETFVDWLANDKLLAVNERLSEEDGYYLINNADEFKELLAFGQDHSLRFRLKSDLDLGQEANFYIPYLAGVFDGNGHTISNLNFNVDFVSQVGLFGYVGYDGKVSDLGVEDVIVTGDMEIGGLVGFNDGRITNCYSTGSVTARGERVGGLVGGIHTGTVSDAYSRTSVTGPSRVGGLVGWIYYGTVRNSYYNYDEVLINDENMITTGALSAGDFDEWLDNDRFLDVNERLSQEDGYYLISSVNDLQELLVFGQDESLRYRLTAEIDLSTEPGFYIPYLAGQFNGGGYTISNLGLSQSYISQVGLFGHVTSGGSVKRTRVENASISEADFVGALVGWNRGSVLHSSATGSLAGHGVVGGLVGENQGTVTESDSAGYVNGGEQIGGLVGRNAGGTIHGCHSSSSVYGGRRIGGLAGSNAGGSVSESYATGSVTGAQRVGGLVGELEQGTVRNSFSAGSVAGEEDVGGLIGFSHGGTVTNSFWDTQASGTGDSADGTGKATSEMKSVATFEGAGWDIIAVAESGHYNTDCLWNIVDGQTYPFLSWTQVEAPLYLTAAGTAGGSVTSPGEGTFAYEAGTVVDLVATAWAGYEFVSWTGDTDAIADVGAAETTIAIEADYSVTANFEVMYDTVLDGLSYPMIHGNDGQGRIYFTQFDPLSNEGRINRLDPHTEVSVTLIEHQNAGIRMLSLDAQENLYYVLRLDVQPPVVQIRKLAPGEVESQILFATEESDQWLTAMTVDGSGNVYFALQSWDQHSGFLPGSELHSIHAGTTTTETLLILQDAVSIVNLNVDDDPSVLHFTSATEQVDRIYRFDLESSALDTILERTTDDSGQIAYLAARADGELYYLYRQRSDQADPVQFGYLEIGRFTLEDLEAGLPPELLVADELDQAVWAWFATTPSFFAVSDTGDVFFNVILYREGLIEQAPFGIFWYDPHTGVCSVLVEGTVEKVGGYTFALDNDGSIYYAKSSPGAIVRISR